jgi:myosin heavy subunit
MATHFEEPRQQCYDAMFSCQQQMNEQFDDASDVVEAIATEPSNAAASSEQYKLDNARLFTRVLQELEKMQEIIREDDPKMMSEDVRIVRQNSTNSLTSTHKCLEGCAFSLRKLVAIEPKRHTRQEAFTKVTELQAKLQAHTKIPKNAQQLEQENADLKARVSALERENADLKSKVFWSSEQRGQQLERTNADLMMRIEAFESQASTEHNACAKMVEKAEELKRENTDLAVLLARIEEMETQANTVRDACDAMMEMSQRLEKENADLKSRNSGLKCRVSSLERENVQLSSSSKQIALQLEKTNADLKCRDADSESTASSLERENASISSSEQSSQQLENQHANLKCSNADLIGRVSSHERKSSISSLASSMTHIGTEEDACDAHHAEMIKITQHREEQNDDLKPRLSSLKAGCASISSPDQHTEKLERMRVQALQMREIANKLQKENADLKRRSADNAAHDASSCLKEAGFEQDTQETQKEEAQQAHELQKSLPQKNQDLENQVQPDLLVKDMSFAPQDNARQAMQDKEPPICSVAGHVMPARNSETSPCVNPASALDALCSSRVCLTPSANAIRGF